MDFIEKLFGVSPDGGDGTTELVYVAALLAVVAVVILGRVLRPRGATPNS